MSFASNNTLVSSGKTLVVVNNSKKVCIQFGLKYKNLMKNIAWACVFALLHATLSTAATLAYANGRMDIHLPSAVGAISEGFGGYLVPLELLPSVDAVGCTLLSLDTLHNKIIGIKDASWIALVASAPESCSLQQKADAMVASGAGGLIMECLDDSTDLIPFGCLDHDEYASLIHDTKELWKRDTSFPKPVFRVRVIPDPSRFYIIIIVMWPVFVIAMYETGFRLKKRWTKQKALTALESIPVKSWHNEFNTANNNMCPICIEDYSIGDLVRILRCGHDFHATCVDRWLTSMTNACPLCKKSCLPQSNTLQESDSDEENLVFPELDADLPPHELAVNFTNHTLSNIAEATEGLVPMADQISTTVSLREITGVTQRRVASGGSSDYLVPEL
ncbi:UNVERIFIED_CONTAM: hypothetical protein HDU68_003784 [Siphonaria sp. JEL0065]|nr:hypothetical protein HDU68_003784 [Siphonaria sp. JEL0065]